MKTRMILALIVTVFSAVGVMFWLQCMGAPESAHAVSATQDAIPSVDFIAAAMKDQEVKCGASIEVTFTKEFVEVGREDTRYSRSCRYIRTPDALGLDMETPGGSKDTHSYDRNTGEARVLHIETSGSKVGNIKRSWLGPFGTQDCTETTRFPLYSVPGMAGRSEALSEQIANGSVIPKMEIQDGHNCWRVEIPAPKKYTGTNGFEKYVVLVDPNIGFCPRSIQIPWRTKKATIITFKEYVEVGNGVWFPKKQTIESSDGTQDYVTTNTINEVHIGRQIAANEVMVTFPSGTRTISFNSGNPAEFIMP